MQREQRIISGKLLEANFYPIFSDGRRMPRGPKIKKSTAAQERYNRQKSVKRAIRDINTNFDTDDLFLHPTYAPADAPRTKEEAKRNIDNFRRRIETKRISELKRFEKLLSFDPQNKEYRKRIRILKKPFRWYYRLEQVTYKSGPYAGKTNYHYHLFITGGIDRDTIEDMWPYRINADRFRPDKFGAEAAARYATKPSEKWSRPTRRSTTSAWPAAGNRTRTFRSILSSAHIWKRRSCVCSSAPTRAITR